MTSESPFKKINVERNDNCTAIKNVSLVDLFNNSYALA